MAQEGTTEGLIDNLARAYFRLVILNGGYKSMKDSKAWAGLLIKTMDAEKRGTQ
jgi:hypothetical protein